MEIRINNTSVLKIISTPIVIESIVRVEITAGEIKVSPNELTTFTVKDLCVKITK